MLFDHCAECQSCCRVDAGYPPLEVTLSKAEEANLGPLCIEHTCEHLGDAGCTLGGDKPFGCQLYPLAYDPQAQTFFFDAECPLMPVYRKHLKDPNSEASQHLQQVSQVIARLSANEPGFLHQNFQVDTEYFDIRPLRAVKSSKKVGT